MKINGDIYETSTTLMIRNNVEIIWVSQKFCNILLTWDTI